MTENSTVLKDLNDTFVFHDPESTEDAYRLALHDATVQESGYRHIIGHIDGSTPANILTPSFDTSKYFEALHASHGGNSEALQTGDVLLYGEIVTSTQTLLDK